MSTRHKYHTIISRPTFRFGSHRSPCIYIDEGGGTFLREAWAYMQEPYVQELSPSWREKMARDIGLFYEYFRLTKYSVDQETAANNLINSFLSAAIHGTMRSDGIDPMGLYWKGMSINRGKLLQSNLRSFLLFLADYSPGNHLSLSRFAKRTVSSYALECKKRRSSLFHLHLRGSTRGAATRGQYFSGVVPRSVKKFPRSLLPSLVLDGCRLQRARCQTGTAIIDHFNINMFLSLCLLIGGGIRKSELFHIWVDDVRPINGKIYLFHPVHGIASGGRGAAIRRKEYLLTHYSMAPRNLLPHDSALHAGWKNLLIDDPDLMCSEVYWCHPFWKELFLYAFLEYRDKVRPDAPGHPYLFVSLIKASFGAPWTIQGFNKGWEAALGRINLTPAKRDGINPHGLRHAYGQLLKDLGLDPQYIQRAMHHTSPLSQEVYTVPEPTEINAALQACHPESGTRTPVGIMEKNRLNRLLYSRKDPAELYRAWGR